MFRFIVGVVLALVAVLSAYIVEGGSLGTLLGLTAFLITFFVPFFGVLAVWSFSDWRRAWGHAFQPAGKEIALVSVEIWKFTEFASYLAGILGSLVGGVLILGNLDSGQVPWSRALAALLVAPIYGCLFGFIARILKARVNNLHP